MNKLKKFKNTINNLTEDSSDYVSSDVETGNLKPKSNSNIDGDDYSNDSFAIADYDNSHTDKRFRKANQDQAPKQDSRLIECLNYLHSMIGRKDKEDIFQFPVTDLIAPGYSSIIKNPMDLSTMKKKIETGVYINIMEYRDDLILMCENCMTYNKPDTIYYHAARKMLDYGFKLLSRDKLLSLRHTVRIMRMLTPDELGFSPNVSEPAEMYYDVNKLKKQQQLQQQNEIKSSPSATRLLPTASLSKSKILQKLDALQSTFPKESYLVPPEGEEKTQNDDEDITESVLEAAKNAQNNLIAKNKNGKMGFLRRNSNGTTGYHFLKNGETNSDESNEKPLTIGNLSEGLQQGSYSMTSFIEEKKNKAKPMHYLENGPFSSHAPAYDSSYSNLSKEESDVLITAYGDETGYQYALSLMEFAKDTTPDYNNYVNNILNDLSSNDHEKYLKHLKTKNETDTIKTEAKI